MTPTCSVTPRRADPPPERGMIDREEGGDLVDLDPRAPEGQHGVHRGVAVGQLVLDDHHALAGPEPVHVVGGPQVGLRLLERDAVRQIERQSRGEDHRPLHRAPEGVRGNGASFREPEHVVDARDLDARRHGRHQALEGGMVDRMEPAVEGVHEVPLAPAGPGHESDALGNRVALVHRRTRVAWARAAGKSRRRVML